MRKNDNSHNMYHDSEISISDLFANTPGHIYAKDKEGIYLAVNNRDEFSCASDGTKEGSALVGKSDKDFPWKEVAEVLQSNDREVVSSNKTQIFIEKGKLEDGKLATFISIKSPLSNKNGDIIGIIGNSIDITEVKEKLKKLL